MSGPTASSEERLRQIDALLDDYERSLGLPAGTPPMQSEATKLLEMEPSLLRKLTPEQAGEAAVILSVYAFHLQRAVNKEQSRVAWAEESIRKAITAQVGQQRGSSFEERKMLAVRGDDAASKLDRIRVQARLRVERLAFLARQAEAIVRSLLSLQQAKRGVR
jgi:hypothetical protein